MATFKCGVRWGTKWFSSAGVTWPFGKITFDASWLHIETILIDENFIIPYNAISEVRCSWLENIRIIHTMPNVPPYLVIASPFGNNKILIPLKRAMKQSTAGA